jgi:lysophospholipase L1-like esterase
VKTILFFGDSLTAGYMLSNPAEESFPARIAQKLHVKILVTKSLTQVGAEMHHPMV